jgi:hypothetical protein
MPNPLPSENDDRLASDRGSCGHCFAEEQAAQGAEMDLVVPIISFPQ